MTALPAPGYEATEDPSQPLSAPGPDGSRDRSSSLPSHSLLRSTWSVGACIFLVYGLWILAFFRSHHDPRDAVHIGREYVAQSHSSSLIRVDPNFHYGTYLGRSGGYDGQWSYYIALDPVHARYYMDSSGPAYRYTRILYPMLARLLALGRASLVPYTLLLINWLAIVGGTVALAAWLKRRRISPWLAVIYGLYPGLFTALSLDLTEAIAFGLVALAIYLFDFGGSHGRIWSAAAFALAILARETSAVFAVVYGVSLLFGAGPSSKSASASTVPSRMREAVLFFTVALTPMLAYKVFLRLWLGTFGGNAKANPTVIPLAGFFAHWPWQGDQILEFITVIVPTLICLWKASQAIQRRRVAAEVWSLMAAAATFVVFLNPFNWSDIFGAERVATGVVLAALYCVPAFDRLTNGDRRWLFVSSACWLFLSIWLVPIVIYLVGAFL